MPKKSGIVFVTMGAVLILSALLLFLHNETEDCRAGQGAELLMDDIHSVIAEKQTSSAKPSVSAHEISTITDQSPVASEMPVVTIDGYGYIGYISIPDLELELPVMAEWDYQRLEIAPCRHFGSTVTDDLVIAGHNYTSHFATLSELQPGAEVVFTDMDGVEHHYTLTKEPEALAPNDVDAVQNSGHDLVLYTCTRGGMSRWVALCDRTIE